jgi:Fe-S oxidoreductase
MREHLRYGPAYSTVEPATAQDFSAEGGYAELVELCNGCGTCRQTDTDTMCPTYRATEEEIATTRGRANLLRAGISGELPEGELYSERFLSAVLDLCIGCKGCKSDCPTGVDMAKLKAELKREYHEREGVGLRERLFANVDRLSALGSKTAPLSNWLASLPGASAVAERALGIASERSLPEFRRESLEDWFDARGGPRVAAEDAEDAVLLFPDTYTNYSYPEPGKAAVRVLEAADVRVELASVGPTGRAAYSQGLLDVAADRAHALVDDVAPRVADGRSLLFVEPSDAAMVRDETPDLVGDDRRDAAETVAAGALGICEYLDRARADERIAFDAPGESLAYHGHCHQKALGTDHHAVGVLRRAGYDVDPLDSGCCGMAGSFGYEAEHYDLSQDIGEILFEQVAASDGDVVAPGGSCRAQLGDRADADRPPHPVEKLADAL